MKKLLVFFLALATTATALAQDSTSTSTKPKKDWSKVSMSNRANDHLLLQLGYNGWAQIPDTIGTKGIPRSFNMYFMFDFPFKTDPRFSVGVGAGLGTDNMYFDKTSIDISGRNADRLSFRDVSDTNYFKKYKLMTTYLEAPVELRFSADPTNPHHTWKGALGVKVGTLLSATTKGKTLLNSSGQTINSYTQKEKAKRYFNGTRLSVMGRFGYGLLSIYGSYQINAFIKEGYGPDVRPFQIGITLSGL